MGREEDLQHIAELGRQTRRPTPRWLWIAAAIVGVACATAFAIALFGEPAASRPVGSSSPARSTPALHADERPTGGSGLGAGLVIGAAVGIVIGFAIARQQRGHSSRSNP